MRWSPQQSEAIDAVGDWLRRGDSPIFRLFGYAGSGKTTLARTIAENVDGRVAFGAYTGKAAQVLTTKGCPARTIHQMIYVPKGKSKANLAAMKLELLELMKRLHTIPEAERDRRPDVRGLRSRIKEEEENMKRMSFQLNLESEIQHARLVIIDECSMVTEQMARDLMHFKTPILVLGDPAQLPPIGGGGFFTEATPDIMLTEIHRQARDNPIVDMATRVRQRETLPEGQYGDSAVHPAGTDMAGIARKADQILCGRNKTRAAANRRVRQFLGRTSDLPQTGDRMVCLRNNHQEGLLNGQIWIAAEDAADAGETYLLTAYNEDRENDVKEMAVWSEEPEWYNRTEAEEFDYGYCLTCHKAQGSQWDHVMVMDESRAFKRNAHRWLYTAITRAAEKVDVVRMP